MWSLNLTTTASGTTRDKHNKSYVESPTREHFTAQEVVVSNQQDNPIPVDPTNRGTTKSEYNEVQALTDGQITIINKTIGVGGLVDLQNVHCSGDNIAHFIVEINGQVNKKGRTWWGDFNLTLDLSDETLVEGDNIKIIADNKTNKSAFFNATLKFNEVS